MSFYWVGEGDRAFRSQGFPTQADAEAWLTASYEELTDDGVDAVTLMEDENRVYGPMSLHP